MYDDLLGKRKKKEKEKQKEPTIQSPVLELGKCGRCAFAVSSKVHRRSTNLYCPEIKKYVHAEQMGCLSFKPRNVQLI